MNVRWMAVLTGFVVDIAISALLSLVASPQFFTAPNLAQPGDLLLIGLLALSTGVGGFVAGRMAGESRTINGLLWLDRTGAPWRDIPQRYGPWSTLASRFYRWRKQGIWQRILDALQEQADQAGLLD